MADDAPAPCENDERHCAHRDPGVVYATNPYAYPVVCCRCGRLGVSYGMVVAKVPEGHGEFAPRLTVTEYPYNLISWKERPVALVTEMHL